MVRERFFLEGATLVDGSRTDILVRDGLLTVGDDAMTGARDATRIDAAGLLALPGLVDLHTHLRQPGYEQSETVLTGTRAAAAGGYTTVFAMANTLPVADTAGIVEQELSLGLAAGYATVQPIGAVTVGLAGERLADLEGMAQSAAKVRVFSDDGLCVFDPLLMRRALEQVKAFGGVIAQHAQEPRLTVGAQLNDGALAEQLGLAGWPAVAEESIIARDVLLAEHTESRLHVCHLSTAGSVEVVRWAKARGIDVTAEVTPHHLLLTEELAATGDPRYKVNPPLRRVEDVQALREALADRTIDIVATDHAPHPVATKTGDWSAAANGMVGLESALSVVHRAVVENGMLGWEDVARVMSHTPARIGRVDRGTALATGSRADLLLYDPTAVDAFTTDRLAGKGVNSPYLGRELPGRVLWTIHEGTAVLRDGALIEPAEAAQASAHDRADGRTRHARTQEDDTRG